MKMMKTIIVMLMFLLAGTVLVNAQTQTQAEKDNYTKVITDRSAKYLVNNIGITDTLRQNFKTLAYILVDQYRVTGTIHDTRNTGKRNKSRSCD
jgi:hypothetical protein